MQKSILNIKLVNRPVMRESHIERGANSSRLHTGLKFSEKSMPGRWVKPQRIQRALYRSRDPSAWYLCSKIHFSVTILAPAGWAQDRRCDFAADIMLFYHSCSPVGVGKSPTIGLQLGGQGIQNNTDSLDIIIFKPGRSLCVCWLKCIYFTICRCCLYD